MTSITTVKARADAILLQIPNDNKLDRALLHAAIAEGLSKDRRAMNDVLQGILAELAMANTESLERVRTIIEEALYQC